MLLSYILPLEGKQTLVLPEKSLMLRFGPVVAPAQPIAFQEGDFVRDFNTKREIFEGTLRAFAKANGIQIIDPPVG